MWQKIVSYIIDQESNLARNHIIVKISKHYMNYKVILDFVQSKRDLYGNPVFGTTTIDLVVANEKSIYPVVSRMFDNYVIVSIIPYRSGVTHEC